MQDATAGTRLAVGSPVPVSTVSKTEGAALRIQVVGKGGTTEGTGVLLHQQRREHDVVHYFLTAAHLLNPDALGERSTASLKIRVIVDASTAIEASGANVVFPGGVEQGVDLAIVKATSTNSSLVPVPVSMEAPDPGTVFLVQGYQGSQLTVLTERVRFRSTRLVVGDRTADDVSAFVGAPAMGENGVFGLVSECSSSRVPVITLLAAARGFLTRAVPGWMPTLLDAPAFSLEQRSIDGPVLQVACDATESGDLDIPLTLAPRELPVDATADFTNPRALRLGDVTVLDLQDRLVKLRFTMVGVPPPPFPAACPLGQALVTVRVNVVVFPRQ
jgi:hypothetical protein